MNELSLHGYRAGERVRDTRDGTTGTVHIEQLDEADAVDCGYAIAGEVRWDGSCVADQLEVALPHLKRVANMAERC